MRIAQNYVLAMIVGAAAAGFAFLGQAATSQDSQTTSSNSVSQADAVFAGGCFWCVEADFYKVDGVLQTISGYTGGDLANPSYEQVSHTDTGHLEAVRVIYDPEIVSYEELVDYFWRHIDPLNPNGQFCDIGPSYRTAIFVETPEERAIAEASKTALDEGGTLAGPIVTRIIDQETFWPAEGYHQNYYIENSRRYNFYRERCGRDARIEAVWQNTPAIDIATH
ncbi:peptide-methionine (S)-S-oxide reductase MsrA [Ponticaulis sp.]|uniref:peptide-methionine (S)-S-oxide reductase MsrA n=1 Tax=Ponticaulis sp. TaxID=2020902 RepID=UPI000C951ED4|nr:peptide-methionine (S)-S-oxide reductase MsrA [Ponticaulis sp.]MAI89953.1 peptide-methionine (S)-S-oxide reductase [Ponticaulis sp.]|tara:strand:- start:59437 stop:60105 length:669 start_codon:yes stop_codon:yes gene_type:complete